MTTDIKVRIDALKTPPPPPPPHSAVTPAAAPSPDDDARRLLNNLVDLAAEIRQISKESQQAADDNSKFLARLESGIPHAVRQVVREELVPVRAQMVDQGSRVEKLGAYVSHAATATDSMGVTVRGLCCALIAVAVALVAALIEKIC